MSALIFTLLVLAYLGLWFTGRRVYHVVKKGSPGRVDRGAPMSHRGANS